MKKTLVLLRHGESPFPMRGEKDMERKLSERGKVDANKVGRMLKSEGLIFDAIFSSSATRTQSTSKIVADQLPFPKNQIVFTEEIYETSVGSLLSFINGIDDELNTVLIVGHNPTLSYLTEYLTNEKGISFVPATSAQITFEFENWKMLTQDSGKLAWIRV